jgi:flagellar biogenesis protein FliO
VVLAGGGYFMWRQSRKTKQAAPIKGAHVRVLSGTPIGPKARAVVAEVGGRLILLGVTEHSVRRLAWLDSEPEDVSERVDSRRTEELQDDRRDPLPTQRATTRMASDSSPSILRGSRFSEVLRDAVGLKPKQVVEPAMAIAETTRDRVVLKGKPAKERVNTERSDDYMDIEGQAAGLVARLNRRT